MQNFQWPDSDSDSDSDDDETDDERIERLRIEEERWLAQEEENWLAQEEEKSRNQQEKLRFEQIIREHNMLMNCLEKNFIDKIVSTPYCELDLHEQDLCRLYTRRKEEDIQKHIQEQKKGERLSIRNDIILEKLKHLRNLRSLHPDKPCFLCCI
jgi:hypothetical protein